MKNKKDPIIIAITVIMVILMVSATTIFIVCYTKTKPSANFEKVNNESVEQMQEEYDAQDDEPQKREIEYIKAKQEDFDSIALILSGFIYLERSYDHDEQNGPDNIMRRLMDPIFYVYRYYDEIYEWDTQDDLYISFPLAPNGDGWVAADPLEKFDGFYACLKFPADKIDWIVENSFGIEVDRDNLFKDDVENVFADAYYYDGYYYVPTGDGGDLTYDAVITGSEVHEDGTYVLTLSVGYPNEMNMTYEAVAKLNEVDGEKCWYITSYKEK